LEDQLVRQRASVDAVALADMQERTVRRVASGNDIACNVEPTSDAVLRNDEPVSPSNVFDRVTPERWPRPRQRPFSEPGSHDRGYWQQADSTLLSRHQIIPGGPYGANETPVRHHSQPDVQSFRTPHRQSSGFLVVSVRLLTLLVLLSGTVVFTIR
jgi:hypothetical protein